MTSLAHSYFLVIMHHDKWLSAVPLKISTARLQVIIVKEYISMPTTPPTAVFSAQIYNEVHFPLIISSVHCPCSWRAQDITAVCEKHRPLAGYQQWWIVEQGKLWIFVQCANKQLLNLVGLVSSIVYTCTCTYFRSLSQFTAVCSYMYKLCGILSPNFVIPILLLTCVIINAAIYYCI